MPIATAMAIQIYQGSLVIEYYILFIKFMNIPALNLYRFKTNNEH